MMEELMLVEALELPRLAVMKGRGRGGGGTADKDEACDIAGIDWL
jgi:hypothetical protein